MTLNWLYNCENPWHSYLLLSVKQWNCHYLFLRLRSVASGIRTPFACKANALTHCATAAVLILFNTRHILYIFYFIYNILSEISNHNLTIHRTETHHSSDSSWALHWQCIRRKEDVPYINMLNKQHRTQMIANIFPPHFKKATIITFIGNYF